MKLHALKYVKHGFIHTKRKEGGIRERKREGGGKEEWEKEGQMRREDK